MGLKPDYPDFVPVESEYLRAFWWMLLARTTEDKMAKLYRSNQIAGGVYVGKGQESVSSAMALQLSSASGDIFAPLIRDQAGRMAFGEPIEDCVRTYLGSSLGPMRARDGNVHRGRLLSGLLPMISHLGSMISVASGILFSRKLDGIDRQAGVACLGDGGSSTGAFHEAMNFIAINKLPMVVVIANNQYAYSTHTSKQFACENLADRAIGYGIEGEVVDGTCLASCLEVAKRAVAKARLGKPQLIEAKLLRLAGHGEHDDARYILEQDKASHRGRDCLAVCAERILRENLLTKAEFDMWRDSAREAVNACVDKVLNEPGPDPEKENWSAFHRG